MRFLFKYLPFLGKAGTPVTIVTSLSRRASCFSKVWHLVLHSHDYLKLAEAGRYSKLVSKLVYLVYKICLQLRLLFVSLTWQIPTEGFSLEMEWKWDEFPN